ncbi:hypothetical protein ACW9YQ_07180 [Paraburkholderia strydomiana]
MTTETSDDSKSEIRATIIEIYATVMRLVSPRWVTGGQYALRNEFVMLGFGAQLRGLTVARVVTRKEFGKLKSVDIVFCFPGDKRCDPPKRRVNGDIRCRKFSHC